MKRSKLPSLAAVKRALYADWALRVKQADGWKCLLCGAEDNLTAHHWHMCDHHAHAARYCVDNGATLCYPYHIRGVHQRADWASVSAVAEAVRKRPDFNQARPCLQRAAGKTVSGLAAGSACGRQRSRESEKGGVIWPACSGR